MPGLRFGAYEIVRLIGSGGMGRVYLGRRADGAFSRDVAIKLIDAATHSEELVERFEQERRILASLHHPCIAQLFDAGRARGHLYFVMEYIDGSQSPSSAIAAVSRCVNAWPSSVACARRSSRPIAA